MSAQLFFVAGGIRAVKRHIPVVHHIAPCVHIAVGHRFFRRFHRVFTMPAKDKNGMVATVWELKKEWVKEVRSYEDV